MNLGRYELVEKLASGGMAEVYLAKAQGPMGFQKKIVVKRILPHLAGDAAFSTMFLSEAKLAALLDHPHLVHIFDFGEADGSYFLAMEYIHGLNLSALLKRAKALGESLPFELCARIIAQVCEGLSYAHELVDPATGQLLGLVHRDISPDNILVSASGAVKVVDFGIAKATHQAVQSQTQTGILKGKVAYMSPEQILGQPLDARADLYSLGTVLYELIGGHKPFETENAMGTMQAILSAPPAPITDHRADVPMSLQRILGRALAKERDARYANCRELHQDLERYLRTCGEPVGPFELAQLVSRLSGAGPGAAPVTRAPPAPTRPSPPSTTQLSAVPWTSQEAAPIPPPVQPRPVTRRASPRSWRVTLGGMGGLSLAMMLLWGFTRTLGTSHAEVRPPSRQDLPPVALEWVLPEAWLEGRPPSVWTGVADSRPDEQPASTASVLEYRLAPPRHRLGAVSQSTLRIESNLKGMLRVNGRLLGPTPRTVRGLAPGPVDVEVFDAQGTFAKQQSVTLKPGRQTVRLQVEKGTILLFNQPANTTVEVDGRALGVTPLPPIEVYEGSHSLAFINEKYGRRELKDYRVQAREQQVYRIAMKP